MSSKASVFALFVGLVALIAGTHAQGGGNATGNLTGPLTNQNIESFLRQAIFTTVTAPCNASIHNSSLYTPAAACLNSLFANLTEVNETSANVFSRRLCNGTCNAPVTAYFTSMNEACGQQNITSVSKALLPFGLNVSGLFPAADNTSLTAGDLWNLTRLVYNMTCLKNSTGAYCGADLLGQLMENVTTVDLVSILQAAEGDNFKCRECTLREFGLITNPPYRVDKIAALLAPFIQIARGLLASCPNAPPATNARLVRLRARWWQ